MIQPCIHRRPSRQVPAPAVAAVRIVSRGHYLGDRDPSLPSQMSQSSRKTYAYDVLDRPTGYALSGGAGGSPAEPGASVAYSYDSMGRFDLTFDYANDAAGRRVSRLDTFDGAITTNVFGYNTRSEVTSAAMGTNTYGYAYDPIGNRIEASHNAETNSYTANNLNQYTSIDNAEPTYDADGNMTSDGRGWRYFWNGENRMVCASNAEVCVTYAYDHRGRMVRKDIQRRGAEPQSIAYTWDGWNIIREALATNHWPLATTHNVWGLDFDGTIQGAGGVGGVGGLLAVIAPRPMGEGQQGEGGTIYMPCYDANGNVTEYVSTNGVVAAHYDYSPFGELIDAINVFVVKFTHMFSSKPHCSITGLCEYQMRKYNPEDGQWVNRDPLGNDPRNMIAIAWSSVYENPNCKGHSISEFMPPTDEAKAEFVRKCVGELTPKIEAFQ